MDSTTQAYCTECGKLCEIVDAEFPAGVFQVSDCCRENVTSGPLTVVMTPNCGGEMKLVSEASVRACLSGHTCGDRWALDVWKEYGSASSPHAHYELLNPEKVGQ